MRPTRFLRSENVDPRYGHYLGNWGAFGSQPQRVATYAISSNRQNPFAGAVHAAFFNTFRRSSAQILYWAPPFVVAYLCMDWAIERNEYLNSKPGRLEFADSE